MTSYWRSLAIRTITRVQQHWKYVLKLALLSLSVGAGLTGELFAVAYLAVYLFRDAWYTVIVSSLWLTILLIGEWLLVRDYWTWKVKMKRVLKV